MVPGIVPATLGIPQPALSSNLPFSLVPPPNLVADPSSASSSDDSSRLVNHLPVFAKLFSHACPTKAPGEKNRMHSGYQNFTTCPLTSGEKDRREKARKERQSSPSLPFRFHRERERYSHRSLPDSFLEIISGGQQLKTSDPSAFLLSPSQMFEQNYPTPTTRPPSSSSSAAAPASTTPTTTTFEDWKRPDGWIEAPYVPLQGEAGTLRTVFGLDCEMVREQNLLVPHRKLSSTLEGIPI